MHRRVSCLVIALCVLAMPSRELFAQTENARGVRRTGPAAVPAAVMDAAAGSGRVRVIIGLAVPSAPEGLLQAAERVRQRTDIAAAQNAIDAALARFRTRNHKRFHIVPAMAADVDAAALQALAQRPDVAYIELDELAAPTLAQSTGIIGAPSVWAAGSTGVGQTVAILDTGVDRNHSFFGGRVVSEACYSTTDAVEGSTSVCTAQTGPGSAAPCGPSGCDHGTHVAGIAAGSGATFGGATFSGVAPGANIIAIQVFSDFGRRGVLSYSSDQILGLERIYDLRTTFTIASVNMSLGGSEYSTQAACDGSNTARKGAIDALRSAGIATVIASGNSGFTGALSSPGCISTAVSVGSTTDGSSSGAPSPDQVSNFSNSASFLNLLAPGQTITSSVTGGGFGHKSGTSMAAPHVAGAWAVLKSRMPAATVTQILDALSSTGTGIIDSRNGLTKPRINVDLALAALVPAPCMYTLSTVSVTVPAAASTGTVGVTTQPGCAWQAASNAAFMSISSGAAGSGSGTVTYDVAANAGSQRAGTLSIAGQTLSVMQAEGTAPGPRPSLDFNGADGQLDLLWHHQADGRMTVWTMNGINRVAEPTPTPSQVPETNWKIAGAGDLDADGSVDLVWQNVADGRVSAWLMNGLTLREGTAFSIPQVPDTQWRIRSVGDVNGDGRADLFWQHEGTGHLAIWLLNGVRVIDNFYLSPAQVPDVQWRLAGTADFDGNGSRDLVWHHQGDGRIAIWFMSGATQISGSLMNPGQVPDLNWQIRGVGDLNGDGRPDLLWQNLADGRVSVWSMNGLNLIAGTLLNAQQSDTNWHIVGPR